MQVIYQSIFFVAVALLAIAIAVFVLAVSLLGRAVRLSIQEQLAAEQKRKEDTESEIKKIQEELDKAKSTRKVEVEKLKRSLDDLEAKDRKHRNRLLWIRIKPKLLTANWGALIPGGLFLLSAFLSAYALYYKDDITVAQTYIFFSIVSLVVGMIIVALTLKIIEGIAITSEETSFTREKEALKAAFIESEAEKRTAFYVRIKDKKLPLHVNSNAEMDLGITASLLEGNFDENVEIHFCISEGLDFTEGAKYVLPQDHPYPNYKGIIWELTRVIRGLNYHKTVKIKAPPTPGNYKMIYYIYSKYSWTAQPVEWKIIVD